MNSLLLRRRLMMGGITNYPIRTDYPSLYEFGDYTFNAVGVTQNITTDMFVKSGHVGYSNVWETSATRLFWISINPERIMIFSSGVTLSVPFAGFPVRIKRCAGTESDEAITTFSIVKTL